jgi:solute carrier family 35, member E1
MSGLDTVFYVALWYGLNIGYNIYNKDTSNQFPFPWIIGCISLGAGLLYMLPVWLLGVRKIPKLTSGDVAKIAVRPIRKGALCLGIASTAIVLSVLSEKKTHHHRHPHRRCCSP